jgi:hypothetical protein
VVPVAATGGTCVMVGCGGWRGGGERVWGLRMIGSAVKEREGGNVTVDGKDFGEGRQDGKIVGWPSP